MTPTTKWAALLQIARKRRRDNRPGYFRLSDFHNGYYDCCFVSPWTKSAYNVDAEVMLLGQDWSSSDRLEQPIGSQQKEQKKLGQTWDLPTNKRLREFLFQNMKLQFRETFATNVFPFIKKGGLSAGIRSADTLYAAREYAIPQIEIIAPRIAICFGRSTFEAIRRSISGEPQPEAFARNTCIAFNNTEIYDVPHPGNLGVLNAGGEHKVHERWRVLGERLDKLRMG